LAALPESVLLPDMILSFNPVLLADVHRLCAGREPGEEELAAIKRASAVLLPQGRHPGLWKAASELCGLVFPDYKARYAYPGKIGDTRLFQKLGLPHPATDVFEDVSRVPGRYFSGLEYPVVIKGDTGGEGHCVYLVRSPEEAEPILRCFAGMRASGMGGFVVQEFVPESRRSLRVVVMDKDVLAYWRVGESGDFIHNLSSGGHIDHDSDPELMAKGTELVLELCEKTGINLAGMDVIFRDSKPLLLEINSFFGREGFGGSDAYYERLQQAVNAWLTRHGLPIPTGEFDDSLASERD
jgi:ribosomal protein S6--L-glutamate ligase